jgi:hypothetical protein
MNVLPLLWVLCGILAALISWPLNKLINGCYPCPTVREFIEMVCFGPLFLLAIIFSIIAFFVLRLLEKSQFLINRINKLLSIKICDIFRIKSNA